MGGLAEIVFENVPDRAVPRLLARVLDWDGDGGTGGGPPPAWAGEGVTAPDRREAVFYLSEGSPFTAFGGLLNDVTYRVLWLPSGTDVDFQFGEEQIRRGMLPRLHSATVAAAAAAGASTCYCGIEPACDEETRYFTDGEAGPLAAPGEEKRL